MASHRPQRPSDWTPAELTWLRLHYATATSAEIRSAVGRHSRSAIYTKASELQVSRRPPRLTKAQKRRIAEMHASHSAAEIACALGIEDVHRIHDASSRMGLRKVEPWTLEEDEVLRRHFGHRSLSWIGVQLGRTEDGVRGRAGELELRHPRFWSEEDVALLEAQYRSSPTAALAEHLGRTPSHLHDKARALGLTKRPPLSPEAEELLWEMREMPGVAAHFAERFGVSERAVLRVLRERLHRVA